MIIGIAIGMLIAWHFVPTQPEFVGVVWTEITLLVSSFLQ